SLLFGLLLCAGLVFLSPVTTAAVIEGMRIWRAPDHTRIVLDLSGPVEHVIAPLANPERLVLDITGAALKADPNQLPLADTPVAQISTAVQNQTDERIVFDLKTKVQPRSFLHKHVAGNCDRLVLQLYYKVPEPQPAATASVKSSDATTAT